MLDNIPGWLACKLEYEYIAACAKHPKFPHNGASIVAEEFGEACQAYNDGKYDHCITELAHTMVTCARWMEELSRAD